MIERESFLGFRKTTSQTGSFLSQLIINTLKENDLDIYKCVSQCYDGAAAMRDQYNGVAKFIKDVNPRAMFVHCRTHLLNLVLVDISKQFKIIRNTMGTVQEAYNFFHASKKRNNQVLSIVVNDAGKVELKLKALCDIQCMVVQK